MSVECESSEVCPACSGKLIYRWENGTLSRYLCKRCQIVMDSPCWRGFIKPLDYFFPSLFK